MDMKEANPSMHICNSYEELTFLRLEEMAVSSFLSVLVTFPSRLQLATQHF